MYHPREIVSIVLLCSILHVYARCSDWEAISTTGYSGATKSLEISKELIQISQGFHFTDLDANRALEVVNLGDSPSQGQYEIIWRSSLTQANAETLKYTLALGYSAFTAVGVDVVDLGASGRRLLAFSSSAGLGTDEILAIGVEDSNGALGIVLRKHPLTTHGVQYFLRTFATGEFFNLNKPALAYKANSLTNPSQNHLMVLNLNNDVLIETDVNCDAVGTIPAGSVIGATAQLKPSVLCVRTDGVGNAKWNFDAVLFSAADVDQVIGVRSIPKFLYSMDYFRMVQHGVDKSQASLIFTSSDGQKLYMWSWSSFTDITLAPLDGTSLLHTWSTAQLVPSFDFEDVDGDDLVDLVVVDDGVVFFFKGDIGGGFGKMPAQLPLTLAASSQGLVVRYTADEAFIATTIPDPIKEMASVEIYAAPCTVNGSTKPTVDYKITTWNIGSADVGTGVVPLASSPLVSTSSSSSTIGSGTSGQAGVTDTDVKSDDNQPILLIAAGGGGGLLLCLVLLFLLYCTLGRRRRSADRGGGGGVEMARRRERRSRAGTQIRSGRSRNVSVAPVPRRTASNLRGLARGRSANDLHYGKVGIKSALSADNVIDAARNEYGVVTFQPTNAYESTGMPLSSAQNLYETTSMPLSSGQSSYDAVVLREDNIYDDVAERMHTGNSSSSSGKRSGKSKAPFV